MSKQDRPLEDYRPSKTLSDDNTGSLSASRPSSLRTMTISRIGNTLPNQLSSSPNVPDTSDRLSSPSVRAFARQNTDHKIHKHENRQEAYSQRPPVPDGAINSTISNLVLGSHADKPPLPSQPPGTIRRSVSIQAQPLVLSLMSSLGRIQRSMHPIRRKRATPTKPQQQNHTIPLINNLADAKPFEKLAALEVFLRTSAQSLESVDDLRRLQLATTIHRNVETSLARRRSLHQDSLLRQKLLLHVKDLGLGQLVVVKNQDSCSFCKFECNYGSSNATILLPASASYQSCLDCQPTRLFEEEYKNIKLPQTSSSVSLLKQASTLTLGAGAIPKFRILIKLLSGGYLAIEVKLSATVFDIKSQLSRRADINWDLHHLVSGGVVLRNDRPLSQYRIGPKSLIEVVNLKQFNGSDITQYLKPAFCSGCPWRQVDVKLAKLCLACAEEKYSIINHSRHGAWVPFFNSVKRIDDTPVTRHKQGNCMICTNLGRMKCAGCPLLVCVNCSTHLDGRCKGSLNTLLYSYGQEHIRNDAFLLRSDGGGF